ncbi:MAG: hypothetical protein JO263_06220, partial [Candidatus Eremiobacteraeota bacterium]|nr:hypothetical protein [Candidatus Eremiobacteraeota bacterium]
MQSKSLLAFSLALTSASLLGACGGSNGFSQTLAAPPKSGAMRPASSPFNIFVENFTSI